MQFIWEEWNRKPHKKLVFGQSEFHFGFLYRPQNAIHQVFIDWHSFLLLHLRKRLCGSQYPCSHQKLACAFKRVDSRLSIFFCQRKIRNPAFYRTSYFLCNANPLKRQSETKSNHGNSRLEWNFFGFQYSCMLESSQC